MHIPFNILFLQSSLPPLASPNYLPMGLKVIPELQVSFSPHTSFLFFIRKVIHGITFHPFPPNDINVMKGNLPSSFLLFLLPHPPSFPRPSPGLHCSFPWNQSFLFSVLMLTYFFFSHWLFNMLLFVCEDNDFLLVYNNSQSQQIAQEEAFLGLCRYLK